MNERFAADTRGVSGRALIGLIVGVVVVAAATAASPILGLVVFGLALLLLRSSVVIVDAYERRALTVLGEFRALLEPGIHFVPPLVSTTVPFDLRTQTINVDRQEAITRDNSPVKANAIVYIRVTDPKRAFLEVEDYSRAVANLAQTTLRAVLGDMELDDTLSKRREINEKIRKELAGPTDEWGVRVESVEVEEIMPSSDVLNSMEQQTAAERRRRAMILEAQGERRSAVETAQGEKSAEITRARGKKQSQILEAQGDAVSTVLRAKSAESMGERAVIDKGLEALNTIGKGDAETYVLPQELTSAVGSYGKNIAGTDVSEAAGLDSLDFADDDREMLGLDDIENIVEGLESTNGASSDDIADVEVSEADAVAEADDISDIEVGDAADGGSGTDGDSGSSTDGGVDRSGSGDGSTLADATDEDGLGEEWESVDEVSDEEN